MKRFQENPLSSIIGLLFIAASFLFLFVKTNYDLPLYIIGIICVFGILLIFAKDKFVDILTLGLSRFLSDVNNTVKKTPKN